MFCTIADLKVSTKPFKRTYLLIPQEAVGLNFRSSGTTVLFLPMSPLFRRKSWRDSALVTQVLPHIEVPTNK